MGLDMFLNAKRGIYEFRNDPEATWPGIPEGYRIDSISVEAAYWRKANQIHDWFVQNAGRRGRMQAALRRARQAG